MNNYSVGSGNNQITLTVDIDALGLAATRAIVVDTANPSDWKEVAASSTTSGDIPEDEIGAANAIKGRRLSVLTKIDLFGDEETRKQESERLAGKYWLNHGDDGLAEYNNARKNVSDDFSSVSLHLKIDLK